MSKKPDWEVFSVRKTDEVDDKEPKDIWTKHGVAFMNENGKSGQVLMDSWPVSGRKLILLKPKDENKE